MAIFNEISVDGPMFGPPAILYLVTLYAIYFKFVMKCSSSSNWDTERVRNQKDASLIEHGTLLATSGGIGIVSL